MSEAKTSAAQEKMQKFGRFLSAMGNARTSARSLHGAYSQLYLFRQVGFLMNIWRRQVRRLSKWLIPLLNRLQRR